MFASAVVQDEDTAAVLGQSTIPGLEALSQHICSKIFPLVTTHFITNIRVELRDEDTAYMTANALAYHLRPEDAFNPDGNSYMTRDCIFWTW
jgi:hypothetical protein